MLKAHQVMLETDIVSQVDEMVSERERSDWIRGAMRLRLVIEQMVADDEPVTDAKARQALGLIESPVTA